MNVHGMRNVDLQQHIRTTAQDTSKVVVTAHACERMLEREVLVFEIYSCLQHGEIVRPPTKGKSPNSRKCRMEHFVAGRPLVVIVVVDGDDPDLIVVTLFADGEDEND